MQYVAVLVVAVVSCAATAVFAPQIVAEVDIDLAVAMSAEVLVVEIVAVTVDEAVGSKVQAVLAWVIDAIVAGAAVDAYLDAAFVEVEGSGPFAAFEMTSVGTAAHIEFENSQVQSRCCEKVTLA